MKKVFISMPMKGRTKEQIEKSIEITKKVNNASSINQCCEAYSGNVKISGKIIYTELGLSATEDGKKIIKDELERALLDDYKFRK